MSMHLMGCPLFISISLSQCTKHVPNVQSYTILCNCPLSLSLPLSLSFSFQEFVLSSQFWRAFPFPFVHLCQNSNCVTQQSLVQLVHSNMRTAHKLVQNLKQIQSTRLLLLLLRLLLQWLCHGIIICPCRLSCLQLQLWHQFLLSSGFGDINGRNYLRRCRLMMAW